MADPPASASSKATARWGSSRPTAPTTTSARTGRSNSIRSAAIHSTGYTLTRPDGSEETFSGSGAMLCSVASNGNTTTLSWTEYGLTITAPAGQTATFTYNTSGSAAGLVGTIAGHRGWLGKPDLRRSRQRRGIAGHYRAEHRDRFRYAGDAVRLLVDGCGAAYDDGRCGRVYNLLFIRLVRSCRRMSSVTYPDGSGDTYQGQTTMPLAYVDDLTLAASLQATDTDYAENTTTDVLDQYGN